MKIPERLALIVLCVIMFMAAVSTSVSEQVIWDCPQCGRQGNTGNYCGTCGYPVPRRMPDASDGDYSFSDAELKARISMPYGLKPGMTVEEANSCMLAAGFQSTYNANGGATIYYDRAVVEEAETYSSLMSVLENGVIHVIHFYLESPGCSRENPGTEYLRIQNLLKEEYGAVSYTMENNGSDGWVNDSIEIHFGHLESNGILYYVLAYWYLPQGIKYNGF